VIAQAFEETNRRGKLIFMRLALKWSDGCGVQYVQREAALGTASLHADIEHHAKALAAIEQHAQEWEGVMGMHVVFPPYACGKQSALLRLPLTLCFRSRQGHRHCFKFIHDAAGKVFVDYKNKAVMGREWTISDIEQHYDYNAAFMLQPKNENFNFDFDFKHAHAPQTPDTSH
jgi:hypothetical protein